MTMTILDKTARYTTTPEIERAQTYCRKILNDDIYFHILVKDEMRDLDGVYQEAQSVYILIMGAGSGEWRGRSRVWPVSEITNPENRDIITPFMVEQAYASLKHAVSRRRQVLMDECGVES